MQDHTIATSTGVIIAETRHIDLTDEDEPEVLTATQARQAGVAAARDGRVRAPACDATIMCALSGRSVGDRYNIEIMQAFLAGYDATVLNHQGV